VVKNYFFLVEIQTLTGPKVVGTVFLSVTRKKHEIVYDFGDSLKFIF
jgi:hypothetical protein